MDPARVNEPAAVSSASILANPWKSKVLPNLPNIWVPSPNVVLFQTWRSSSSSARNRNGFEGSSDRGTVDETFCGCTETTWVAGVLAVKSGGAAHLPPSHDPRAGVVRSHPIPSEEHRVAGQAGGKPPSKRSFRFAGSPGGLGAQAGGGGLGTP